MKKGTLARSLGLATGLLSRSPTTRRTSSAAAMRAARAGHVASYEATAFGAP